MTRLNSSLWRLLIISAVAAAGLSAPAGPVRAQAAGPVYVVQAGDTLYGIARQFGLSLDALMAANPAVNPNALPVGQALILPGFGTGGGTLGTHLLEPGESLDSLALRFGLQRATLVRLNRLVNPAQLFINQPVVISDQADAGTPLSAGAAAVIPAGQGLLSVAAERGLNPWALAAVNRLAHPGRPTPGSWVAVPGGDRPLKALPAPLTDIQVGPWPVAQGGTLVVRVAGAAAAQLTGALGEWPLTFVAAPDDPNVAYALLGINRLAEPNLYPLNLQWQTAAGPVAFLQAVPVRAGQYGSDPPLTVDPATVDPAIVQPEWERLQAVIRAVTPERRWSGLFLLPSVGSIRSLFGALRSYNGGPYETFHGGVDFSGGDDRPITAPAPGVVVLAEPLTVRGNATVLDHGWGVYSGYWHQSQLLVQAGQRVEAGQIIGYQGSTGRVTGPHLHWEIFVGGYQVEPLTWTEIAFP